jgi:hypothetical protein
VGTADRDRRRGRRALAATARAAASHFVGQAVSTGISVGTRLLADIRSLFTRHDTDRMTTVDIIGRLLDDDEAGWADLDPRPLDARRLAKEMSRYQVRPGTIRVGGQLAKGYQAGGAAGLADAWTRYLPPVTDDDPTDAPPGAVTSVTSQVRGVTAKSDVTATSVTPPVEPPPAAPPEPGDVTATAVTPKSAVTGLTRHVTDVTDVTATDGGA